MSGFSPEKRPTMQTRKNLALPALHQMPTLNPFTAINAKFTPSTEENEEFRLTLGGMGRDKGKKRAFSIFQDVPEESPGELIGHLLDMLVNKGVGRTESPLEDFMSMGPQRYAEISEA